MFILFEFSHTDYVWSLYAIVTKASERITCLCLIPFVRETIERLRGGKGEKRLFWRVWGREISMEIPFIPGGTPSPFVEGVRSRFVWRLLKRGLPTHLSCTAHSLKRRLTSVEKRLFCMVWGRKMPKKPLDGWFPIKIDVPPSKKDDGVEGSITAKQRVTNTLKLPSSFSPKEESIGRKAFVFWGFRKRNFQRTSQ